MQFCNYFAVFGVVNQRFKDVQHIIESKRELLSRETYSLTPVNYSEGMVDDQKKRYIQYLAEQHQEALLIQKAMQFVLEAFMARQKELEEQLSLFQSRQEEELSSSKALQSDLLGRLSEEGKLRKSAEHKLKSLQEKLDYADQELFGDRRQKVRKQTASGTPENPEPDRGNEKDVFDGIEATLSTDSVDNNQCGSSSENAGKERDLPNCPDVLGRIIERRSVPVFSLKTILVEELFEMVHYVESGRKPKWGYFPSDGHPEVVTRFEGTTVTPEFLQTIAYEVYVKNVTFGLLHQWLTDMRMTISANTLRNRLKKGKKYLDESGLTPEERLRERQGLETKEIVIRTRSGMDSELAKETEFRSPYYTEALNYLNKFWKELFSFLDDGELPIDNNLAERTIRKLTTQRNNSLHYGSDVGAEMAATYHSVISTVKLHGSLAWDFIGTFFKKILNGCRDYVNMVPDKIALATGQC